MAHVEAYQTVKQELFYGDSTRLIDLSSKVNMVNVASQLRTSPRVVLGRKYPIITVTRIDYRLVCQQVLVDAETDTLYDNPRGIVVLRQTDSERTVSYEAVIAGIPEQAAAEGEIIGAVTIQPTGRINESMNLGEDLPAALPAGNRLVVIRSGTGEYTIAGSSTQLATGVHVLPAAGDAAITGDGFAISRTLVN